MRRHLALLAALIAWASSCADMLAAQERTAFVRSDQASIFGGVHVSNVWQDAFKAPGQLDWDAAGLIGVAFGHQWRRPDDAFSYGVELQAVGQVGRQEHFEFNLPFVLRYHTQPNVPALRSLALGIGPSFATEVPQYEVETRGDSEKFLVYWTLEAEFGPGASALSLFTRLHHRSGAFGTVADEGSSNVIVWGLRRRW